MIEVIGSIEKEERFEATCGNCGKQLRFGKDDVQTGAFGCAFLVCPVCGEEIDLMDEKFEKNITPENVVYPDDFFVHSDALHIEDEKIEEDIRSLAKKFKADKDSDYLYMSTGDLGLLLLRDDENDIIIEVLRPIASTSMRDCA